MCTMFVSNIHYWMSGNKIFLIFIFVLLIKQNTGIYFIFVLDQNSFQNYVDL